MEKRRFINPFTDFGFRYIFGREIHKDLLIDFLNEILKGEREIADLRIKDPNILPATVDDRLAIFDIYCVGNDGTEFVVEMQCAAQHYFYERGLYYLARALSIQGEKGNDWKFNLRPVYGIFFLNYTMGGVSKLRTDIILADRETGKQFSDKLRQIYIELPRFTKEADECENDFERWLYLLKNMEILERMPFKARKASWDKLLEVADVAALSKEERIRYDEALKNYRDYHNTIDYAYDKGEERGIEKGLKRGIEKGRKEGKAEERLQIAKSLKDAGLPIAFIRTHTGLSEEEIKSL